MYQKGTFFSMALASQRRVNRLHFHLTQPPTTPFQDAYSAANAAISVSSPADAAAAAVPSAAA